MLKRCEETNLVLNWEKCHFIVKEGIVLGHRVSGSRIVVDKSKKEAISKLSYPMNGKAIRKLPRTMVYFYRRFIKDFSQEHKPNDPSLKRLIVISDKNNELWYADYANYLASRVLPFRFTRQEKKKFFSDLRHYFRMSPSYSNNVLTESYKDAWPKMRQHKYFENVAEDHLEDIMASPPPQEKYLRPDFTGHISFEMHVSWYRFAMHVNEQETSHQGTKHLKNTSKSAKYSMFGESTLWNLSPHQTETNTS
ncbi:hypothetical protein Tco_0550848 [Tanacetum coccineum]